jgi:hypothetical protein
VVRRHGSAVRWRWRAEAVVRRRGLRVVARQWRSLLVVARPAGGVTAAYWWRRDGHE